MGRLEGKVALITGGAGGQGAAESRLFLEQGAKVAVGDITDDAGTALADELGDDATYVHLDVTSEDDWSAAVQAVETQFGKLDVVVNNAGILKFSALADTKLADYMQVVNVNQVGTFLGMRAAVEPLKRAGGGSIVNISSIEGFFGGPFLVAYTASKFAVRGMTKVAAVELGQYGIRVNSIHPGAVQTNMTGDIPGVDPESMAKFLSPAVPLGRLAQAEDVANLCLFLASDESSYCTGSEFVIDGGVGAYIRWPGIKAHPNAVPGS
jgi:3alpha(or 20beta)-hydroxysteroid dehydrogenase